MLHEQTIYWQITEILARFMNEDLTLNTAADEIMLLIKDEREDSADNKLWDFEIQQFQDLLWQSRITGAPDMFSDELRSFWARG